MTSTIGKKLKHLIIIVLNVLEDLCPTNGYSAKVLVGLGQVGRLACQAA